MALIQNLEPGAEPPEGTPDISTEKIAIVSIAISLKRIADVLDGQPDRLGVVEHLVQELRTFNPGG